MELQSETKRNTLGNIVLVYIVAQACIPPETELSYENNYYWIPQSGQSAGTEICQRKVFSRRNFRRRIAEYRIRTAENPLAAAAGKRHFSDSC